MAGFDVQTITAAGASLIAAATAQNKLILDGCDATTAVLTREQAIAISSRPANPGSNTTDVALAGSTDNHVYAYAEFIRGSSTGGEFNTFYLYGHSQSSPSNIRVIAVVSAAATTHLPTSTDTFNRSEIQFELTFSATDEVVEVASTSMYTTRGEFLLLKNRTVTTHAEGETTVGDDQTIYGDKTFADGLAISTLSGIGASPITLASSLVPSGIAVKVGTYDNMFSEMCAHYFTYFYNASEGFVQSGTGSGSNGTQFDCTWYTKITHRDFGASFYARTRSESGTSTIERAGISLQDNMTDMTKIELLYDKSQNKSQIEFTGESKFNGNLIASHISTGSELDIIAKNDDNAHTMANIYFDATVENEANIKMRVFNDDLANIEYEFGYDGEITAYADGFSTPPTTKLGTFSLPFGEAHASWIYTGHLRSPGSSISVCSLEPYGTAPYIGTQALPFDTIQSLTFKGADYLPDGVVQSNVGKSNNRFAGVYANTLDGVLIHPTSNSSAPPVGSIVFICVADTGVFSISAGDLIQAGSGYHQNIKYASWNNGTGTWAAGSDITGAVFRALSEGSSNTTNPCVNFVLAIRVQ